MWQLRSFTKEEATFLYRANPPLRWHALTLHLGPPGPDSPPQCCSGMLTPRCIPFSCMMASAWLTGTVAYPLVTRAHLASLEEPRVVVADERESSFVVGLLQGTNAQGLLQQIKCTSQLRPVLGEIAFRLERVQLLLADIERVRRLSPYIRVECFSDRMSGCAVQLVFSLLDRGCKFSVRFEDLHYGFPYAADLRWTFERFFGPVGLNPAVAHIVDRHTAAPSHGFLARLSQALLALH